MFKNKLSDNEILTLGFTSLIENMFLLALTLDKDGLVTYANRHFYTVTGYTKDEVLGKNWFDLFIPIKKIDTVKKTFEIIIKEKYQMRSENPILAKDGKEINIEWDNTPLFDKKKNVIGTVSVGVDITGRLEIENLLKTTEESSRARATQVEAQNKILNDTKKGMLNLLDDSKRLEEELQQEKKSVERKVVERTLELNQEKARLEAAINAVPSGFIVADKKGHVLLRNSVLCKVLGVSTPEECSLDRFSEFFPNIPFKKEYERCYSEKTPINIKEIDFGKKVLEIYMAPIFIGQISDEVIGVIVLLTDVTEEKIVQRSKDEFFSIASHELRTPITAIRGNIELINKYYADKIDDSSFKQMLGDMSESSTRLIHLVNEFLNTSRLEQGKLTFNISTIDLKEITENVINELQSSAIAKGLELKLLDSSSSAPLVKADSDRVKEILVNLIGNAIAYTDAGTIDLDISQEDGFGKVRVTDTGKGIPEKNHQLLFRKFQQANTNIYARDISNSTGLGLYISKLLVESMGGKIFLEKSQENVGSTFAFTLPVDSV